MSEGVGLQPIARWRIVASLALIAQVVILLAFKSALEEESWFVGSVSATVDEGPLQLEGVSVNLSIDMQEEQDDVSIEFFGPLRLSQWQNERDDRATLSEQQVEEYDENIDEAFFITFSKLCQIVDLHHDSHQYWSCISSHRLDLHRSNETSK